MEGVNIDKRSSERIKAIETNWEIKLTDKRIKKYIRKEKNY